MDDEASFQKALPIENEVVVGHIPNHLGHTMAQPKKDSSLDQEKSWANSEGAIHHVRICGRAVPFEGTVKAFATSLSCLTCNPILIWNNGMQVGHSASRPPAIQAKLKPNPKKWLSLACLGWSPGWLGFGFDACQRRLDFGLDLACLGLA